MNLLTRRLLLPLLLAIAGWAGEAAAFYNPQTGRWLSRAPVGEGDGPNAVSFVWNRPVSTVDDLGKSSISTVGMIYPSSAGSARSGTQLAEWSRSLVENTFVFRIALVSLCPKCESIEFKSRSGQIQKCTLSKCLALVEELAAALAKAYATVFTTEHNKLGNILVGLDANQRADKAPNHGMIASDFDQGFGLKCAGWTDLTGYRFLDTIAPYYREGSQCFRAAMVGKPADGGSWRNHSWTIIYGPNRGQLNTSMFKKTDYDIPVDPWPVAGKIITPVVTRYEAERLDQPLLW